MILVEEWLRDEAAKSATLAQLKVCPCTCMRAYDIQHEDTPHSISKSMLYTLAIRHIQGHIEPLKAARGHATYMNVKIQTWLLVPKISYAVYGYTTFAHAQVIRVSSCKSHSYAIKQIHGPSQPPFPCTAIANIRKTSPCLNLDIHMAIYGSYMPSRRLQQLDTPLVYMCRQVYFDL